MASRVVVNGRITAAAEGNGYPEGSYLSSRTIDEEKAVIHYDRPPSSDFVLDERYGVRFRVITKAPSTEGWVTTSTMMSWLYVSYAQLMDLVISGDVDCCVEAGSPVRMFRILRRDKAMKLRAKGLGKKR